MDNEKKLTCDDCGTKEGVSETTCPYDSEINNKRTECNLCDDCYYERNMEV